MIKIELENITGIIEQLENIDFDCDELFNLIDGDAEKQLINENYTKVIIRKVTTEINTVIVDCYNKKIMAIFFDGNLDIKVKEIAEKYKEIQERYSFHDDLYFYSFEIKKNNKNYTISFFEPFSNKIDLLSDTNLYNLGISLTGASIQQ